MAKYNVGDTLTQEMADQLTKSYKPSVFGGIDQGGMSKSVMDMMGNIDPANYAIDPLTNQATWAEGFTPTMQDATAFDMYNTQFDTPWMDYAGAGLGAASSIAGIMGSMDNMKTNKVNRNAVKQNMGFAKQDQDYRVGARTGTTNAFRNTKSAFA